MAALFMGLKAQHRQQVTGKGAMHERKEEGSAHREDGVPPPHGKNIRNYPAQKKCS